MAIELAAIGKEWPGLEFEVEAERVREYARVTGFESPLHQDVDAARESGFRDLVAPPMFCVVYAGTAMWPVLTDPELAMDFDNMVHGGQEFVWGEPVCAGDVITTAVTCTEINERRSMGMYTFESVSTNQLGEQVVRGIWSNIVRVVAE